MPNKSKKFMRFLTLLLALVISLAVPLQSLSATTFAASTAASDSSSASSTSDDEPVSEWMPDTALQQAVYDALHNPDDSHQTQHGNDITSKSQITKAMMTDIVNIPAPNAKITDLTGLQYATNLVQFDFSGSTITKAPGDDTSRSWSIFDHVVYNNLGTVDASSPDVDLSGLLRLSNSANKPVYVLSGDSEIGMPNTEYSPTIKTGIQVKSLIPGNNITYNPLFSKRQAYIPVSNWYKGFVNTDSGFSYHKVTMALPDGNSLPDGVTPDGSRMIIDLNKWGDKELSIPQFAISDVFDDSPEFSGKTVTYYNENEMLDATVPEPTKESQAVQVSKDSSEGTIDTTDFGLGTATNSDIEIQVPSDYEDTNDPNNSKYLTANDISFTPDLTNKEIKFKLTDSGLEKLIANNLTSDVMITVNGKVIDLTLTVTEPTDEWMPDSALRSQLQKILTADGYGDLTKANLANLTKLPDGQTLTGISDLKGLEYAKGLTNLKITDSPNLAVLKESNGQVLSNLTKLTNVEIDNSSLGTLDGWGLDDRPELTTLTATNDALADFGGLTGDSGLTSLDLSHNLISSNLPDLTDYPVLQTILLNNNQITGAVPASWSQLQNLQMLNLSSNSISDSLPDLTNCQALQTLYLNDNHFTGEIPSSWSGLQSLQKLNLSQEADGSEYQLSGSLDAIASLANLSEINLNYNNFSGALPASLFTSKLTSFQGINNEFTGDLPDLSKATSLTDMQYGANHITSGTTLKNAYGNYQTWSIASPDWQTSRDGKTMTLDLSKYYGGEPGQDYQYLGIDMNGGTQTGAKLTYSDTGHPLLTIDTTDKSMTSGTFTFALFDQAKKQAIHDDNGGMNYLATVSVPLTLALPKSYGITTNDVKFGSHQVGSGITNATDFNLSVNSTNAAGDSYQLTAATSGLSAGGHELPLYYYNGQHSVLLNSEPQSIYDYQPTSADDTKVVGDSSQATADTVDSTTGTKGNLRTDVGSTAYTGNYKGNITYTLADAPAENSTTAAQDADLTKISSLSGLSPALSGLSATDEATRATLATNMTSFVKSGLTDADGVLYSSYTAGQSGGTYEELSETGSLWLLALANSGDATDFDTAFAGMVKRFYDSDKGIFNWQSKGADHTITQGSASIDDLRIIQALLIMNQKDPGNNDRVTWLKTLINGFTKYDLNAYYQMIDGYSSSGQEKRIRLDYLDLATLKAIYESKGLYDSGNTAGETAYQQQLKLIKDSYISDKFPFFATFYDYSTGNYQVPTDAGENGLTAEHINITDGLLTMLNLAKVGELPQASLAWLKANTADRHIYNNYNLDGTPIAEEDAASNYGYVAQIAAAVGDTTLYSQALSAMNAMTPATSDSPLSGSTYYGTESYAFNDLNMLLAYNSVAFGTTSSTK
ncbi:leucine-rich repeat domain-containing protein [Levilactobacillus yiduensis]|uniref:leucine-rich repeat domain-containing protein n=1 Tax=Levilactobacillus yiduensis TaxID=2953880 RepID=UPI0021587749|nr:hypothetical protein [Levilactobacillus yiduensis]